MKVVKRIWFDEEGEKAKLTELAKKSTCESDLALKIEAEFSVNFNDAMFIASYWTNQLLKSK